MKREPPDSPRDLEPWQRRALDAFARSRLAQQATFGCATALSAVHLHHRRSQDLDFFFPSQVDPVDLRPIARALRHGRVGVEGRSTDVRQMLVLVSKGREVGHIDFAYFPYDPIDRPTHWRGLRVDSLIDMAVNEVQAVLTRARDRDFVDLSRRLVRRGPG